MVAIQIKKEGDGLAAYADGDYLFEFRYGREARAWFFYVYPCVWEIGGRGFPFVKFVDLCRAVYCLKYHEPIYTSENYNITSGKSYVK